MHFVYICKNGDNEELRYSIRSVLKHAQNASVTVVGGKPDWYKGHYIEVDQNQSKYRNVLNNIHAALNSNEIPNKFILMNDDFYILKNIRTIPTIYYGTLEEKIQAYSDIYPKSSYVSKLRVTKRKLISMGIKTPLNYEVHTPFPVEKDLLKQCIGNSHNNLWRSIYGNLYTKDSKTHRDVKIYNNGTMNYMSYEINDKSRFLSTEDNSFELVKHLLEEMFPEPSPFENDII